MLSNITKTALHRAYKKAVAIHSNHLVGEGVILPQWGKATGYWLAILIHADGKPIHKDTISVIVQRMIPNAAKDQQVRHLKRDGWNLEGDGGYHYIADAYKTHPSFARQKIKSQNLLLAGDFKDIKRAFSHKCATCGAKEGEPDPRYAEAKVKLQQGHRDPAQALDLKNTIPQCQFCNQAYRDDFTFDAKGRVRAVASPKPVLRASKAVRRAVAKALYEKDGKNSD